MGQNVEEAIGQLASDVAAVTMMVEFMYCLHFEQMPDGKNRFPIMADQIKKQSETITFPGVDAVMSDHLAQNWLASVSDILERIQLRLADPKWRPIRSD